ncbi:hypothetical protein ACFYXL_33080 [Streptomyces tsukubensis]|uniref:hypothetical protein n=1 Tax=Streptomyces tsukubensis TaxID=83656 RepID=UPI0036BAE398
MRKRLARMGVTGVACLGAMAATASPAQAAEPHHWMYTNDRSDKGGRVDFWPQGDKVRLCDTQSDGAHVDLVVVNVTKDPNQKEYGLEIGGAGCCQEVDSSNAGANLAEGDCFKFVIRLIKDGREVVPSEDKAQWRNYNNSERNCDGVT